MPEFHMTSDDYKAAGELFGLIKSELKFGFLSMHEDRPRFIVYQWSFDAGGKPYGSRYVFEPMRHRIDKDIPLDQLAPQIVNDWKRFHRSVQPEPL